MQSTDDVESVWSPDLLQAEQAPIRDALIAGEYALLTEYQKRSAYAAAQSDRQRATGEYLDAILGEEFGVPRGTDESDGSYSSRGNTATPVVDPDDIIAAVNAILAPFTNVGARYYEQSDGVRASNPATCTWSNNAFLTTSAGQYATSDYPDRRYALLPNRRPKGHVAFNDSHGHMFVIRVPDISPLDQNVSAAYQLGIGTRLSELAQGFTQPFVNTVFGITVRNTQRFSVGQTVEMTGIISGSPVSVGTYGVTGIQANQPIVLVKLVQTGAVSSGGSVPIASSVNLASPPEHPVGGGGNFAGVPADGSPAIAATFAWNISQSSDNVYQALINAVEAIRGHSMRWAMFSDASLT